MRLLTMTSKLILMLSLITSCGAPPIVTMCVPSKHFDASYCGDYSFEELKFLEDLRKLPLENIEAAFCMPKEEWLTKMRPYLKRLKRRKEEE